MAAQKRRKRRDFNCEAHRLINQNSNDSSSQRLLIPTTHRIGLLTLVGWCFDRQPRWIWAKMQKSDSNITDVPVRFLLNASEYPTRLRAAELREVREMAVLVGVTA